MTAPRKILPGIIYFLTRRCTQRQFLLKPGKYVNFVLLYLLAEAAVRFNITVYAFCAMSNHVHLVVRDNEGNLPEFMAHFYKLIAKVLNVHWVRRENLWSNEQASVVRLAQDHDVLEKILYTLLNPVRANLVERAHEWPGITSYRQMLRGEAKKTKRPHGFFRNDGPMEPEIDLLLERPPGFDTQEEWAAYLAKEVAAVEGEMREARRKNPLLRRKFVGRKSVLAARHTDTATRAEPSGELIPEVACANRELRALELAALEQFRADHECARIEWSAGNRNVAFPIGTYKMKAFGVRVDGEPGAVPRTRAVTSGIVAAPATTPLAKVRAARGIRKACPAAKPPLRAAARQRASAS